MDEFATEYLRAVVLLGIATVLWVVFRLKHKNAEVSLKWLGGVLDSYAITTGFWTSVIGIALIAGYPNVPWILHMVLLILFSKLGGAVTFIEISSVFMSVIWGVNSQSHNSKLDYRFHTVLAISIVAVILMFYYISNGLPNSPASFP
jgi:K+-sensing histidine kinase KdpD